MTMIRPPAAAPCVSCPYRRDVPSGVWDEEEYAKLPTYDGETGDQAMKGALGVFLCHQQDGRACAGWVGCHDMEESLAVRVAASAGLIEDVGEFFDYESSVPLFSSGREAADHGLARVEDPAADARRMVGRLRRKLGDPLDDSYRNRYGEQANRDEGENDGHD